MTDPHVTYIDICADAEITNQGTAPESKERVLIEVFKFMRATPEDILDMVGMRWRPSDEVIPRASAFRFRMDAVDDNTDTQRYLRGFDIVESCRRHQQSASNDQRTENIAACDRSKKSILTLGQLNTRLALLVAGGRTAPN
uniref:Uncharacterized protein n=1 Tax=Bionectria ochroleuca TaxID=29856 RepID=A0A8H7TQS4_BIOOC